MNIGKALSIYAIADLLGKSIGFLISPFLTRLLTPEQYGTYPLLMAVWALTQWIQFSGMETAFQFFRAQDSSEEERRKILVTSTWVALVSALTVWFAFSFSAIVSGWLSEYAHLSNTELLLFCLGLGPGSILTWHMFLFRFTHQPNPFARLNLLSRVMPQILVLPFLFFVKQENRLWVYLLVLSLSQIIVFAFSYFEMRIAKLFAYRRVDLKNL